MVVCTSARGTGSANAALGLGLLVIALVAGPLGARAGTPTTFVPTASSWAYWDSSTAVTDGWNTVAFSDSAWKTGPAPIGFGNNDEATKTSTNKVVHYFRKTFTVRWVGA
jgi:hypothetical protein